MNRKHIIRNLRAKGIEFDANASTKDLNDLLTQAAIVNKVSRTTAFTNGPGKIVVTYNAAAKDEPVQVMVCEDIGKDAWTGEGFALKDLQTALDGVDKNRPLDFQVNSAGGYVSAGTAIRNWLSNWGGVINQTIIGVAASTASWCIPADKTRAFKNSQIFMHRAMAAPYGNVDDLQDAISQLTKTDGQIADMYAEQSNGDPDEMLDLMKGANGQGTLLTGQEALDCGLVDELIDGEAKNNFTAEWLNSARAKLSARNSISALPRQGEHHNNQQNQMKKEQKIALLNKRGVTIPANADEVTLDSLIAASNFARANYSGILNKWKVPHDAENLTDLQLAELVEAGKPASATNNNGLSAEDKALMEGMRNQISNARRKEIREAVNQAASEGRITATEIENWENDAFAAVDHPTNGNPVLNRLKNLEGKTPGVPAIPEATSKLTVESADFKDIRKGFESHNEATKSLMRGNDVPMKTIANAAVAKAQFTKKFRNRFLEMINANTIDAGLQRQFILQDVVIRDFKRRVIGLDMFATVFRNVPLEGTDVVDVPYFDLDQNASQAFAGSYDALVTGTASGARPITVGWGPNKDGALGVGHARLVQALSFSSQEIARQPYLKIAQLAALKAEKLAFDIFQDVLGCVTVANFPTLLTAFTPGANATAIKKSFDQFSSDDLADLKVLCKAWPEQGRGLLIDSTYDGNLLKDPAFKAAYQIALDSVKAAGKLMPKMYGFDYLENPNIPLNGINLKALAFWKYAILVAFAPVPPVDEVRRAGTTWELITDEDGQVSLEYRTYGSNSGDTGTHVIESNYGWAPGLKTAIRAVVSP
jgi:ATP-dependent protease ClpP protease subunit